MTRNRFTVLNPQATRGLLLAAAIALSGGSLATRADDKAPGKGQAPTNAPPTSAVAPAKRGDSPKPARKMSGAELYSMHCNRCHAERYPTERTAAQWKTILLHMRVRANLPAEQARTILTYLQENSGR